MTRRRPNPRAGVFNGFWLDSSGEKLERVQREEWTEIYRLWTDHRDIRLMASCRALPARKAAALGVRVLGMRAQP